MLDHTTKVPAIEPSILNAEENRTPLYNPIHNTVRPGAPNALQ